VEFVLFLSSTYQFHRFPNFF